MATAQNGWPASGSKAAIDVDSNFNAYGVKFPGGVRAGDVSTVLRYVAEQFHQRVEPLRAGQCWGYAYRDVRGARSLSNHAAACAIDVNAPSHPLGKRGTFSAAQVAQITAILGEVDHVVRWGGSYSGRADEMHFEIVGSPGAVATVARKLRGGSGAVAAPAAPPPPAATAGKDDPVAPIALPVSPERTFRAAVMAEAGNTSAVVERAWITVGSTWGDTTFTVTTLSHDGKVLTHHKDVLVRNNCKAAFDVPNGASLATIEGVTQHGGTIPAAALVSKAR